jgi:hypothetical protein
MILNPKNYLDTRWGFGNQVVHAQIEGVGGDALVIWECFSLLVKKPKHH